VLRIGDPFGGSSERSPNDSLLVKARFSVGKSSNRLASARLIDQPGQFRFDSPSCKEPILGKHASALFDSDRRLLWETAPEA